MPPPVQVVTEGAGVACREYPLVRPLRVFKDPMTLDWENILDEEPIRTTLEGNVKVMLLGPPRISKVITLLAKMKEKPPRRNGASSPSSLKKKVSSNVLRSVIPIKVCGSPGEASNDELGFIIESELAEALVSELKDGVIPPSTPGNPIPKAPGSVDAPASTPAG